MERSWLCFGYETSGAARAVLGIPHGPLPPVLHLCELDTTKSMEKLGAEFNLAVYPWWMMMKTMHAVLVLQPSFL